MSDKKTTTLITFWMKRNLLTTMDEFLEKNDYSSRTKFIIDCMMIVYNNPILLKNRKVEPQNRLLTKYVLAFEEYRKTRKIPSITLDNEEGQIYDDIVAEGIV